MHNKRQNEPSMLLTSLIIQLDHDIFNTFDITNFKPLKRPKIPLETTDDSQDFTSRLADKIKTTEPELKNAIAIIPSLKNISKTEYQLYINGKRYRLEQQTKTRLHQENSFVWL